VFCFKKVTKFPAPDDLPIHIYPDSEAPPGTLGAFDITDGIY
jgi:hypothetical protein